MNVEAIDKRRHLRHLVNEPCIAYHEGSEYVGAVVNMSVSGAAVHFDIELDANLESDSFVKLHFQRIGGVRTRVVHPLVGGLAVEFLFDPVEDRDLIERLWKVLNEYAPCATAPANNRSFG